MKDKILKAIDKGLMNVLSIDIEDRNIDFNTADIDSQQGMMDLLVLSVKVCKLLNTI